jgi:hypothetical protein
MPKSFDTFTFEPKSKLTVIDECAFGCCMIKQLVIPASVITLGQLSFYKAVIDVVTFEPGTKLRGIGHCAFQYAKIKSITIPKSVETIRLSCFAGDYRRGSSVNNFVIELGCSSGRSAAGSSRTVQSRHQWSLLM